MSMIRQCDRCGAVFNPYRKVTSDHEKKPTAFVGVSIGIFNYKTESLENDKITTYDLCPKCSRQLNAFMEIPNTDVVGKQMNSNGAVKASAELENIPVPCDDDVDRFVRKLIGNEQ